MGFPTIAVRIAFGSNAMAATPSWDDVSTDVREFGIERGRQAELDRAEPGLARIVLNNASGNYSPENGSGPYYPDILPGKRIEVRTHDYRELVMDDSPVGYWRLGETSGNAQDETTNNNDGTVAAGVLRDQTKLISGNDADDCMGFQGAAA